jgi:hypothetical protein
VLFHPVQSAKDFGNDIRYLRSHSFGENMGYLFPGAAASIRSYRGASRLQRTEMEGQIFGSVLSMAATGAALNAASASSRPTTSVRGLRSSGSAALAEPKSIPMTRANNTWGWKVGQPINNRTAAGNIPKWGTARQRHWKNEAHIYPSSYFAENIPRMRRGRAPQRINPRTGKIESMELHHCPSQCDGGLFNFQPLWPDEHAAIDSHRYVGR